MEELLLLFKDGASMAILAFLYLRIATISNDIDWIKKHLTGELKHGQPEENCKTRIRANRA